MAVVGCTSMHRLRNQEIGTTTGARILAGLRGAASAVADVLLVASGVAAANPPAPSPRIMLASLGPIYDVISKVKI